MKAASSRLSGSSRSISTASLMIWPSVAAVDFAALILVIEREIGVLLEDANLAHALRTDAAGSDVGDAAVLETQARIRDILAAAQHRHADGLDRLHGRAHEMEDDLEIVNHEIEHDADIGAAIRIRGEAMRLDETRMREPFFERAQDGIEALDVADLEDEVTLGGQTRQRGGVVGVFRDRFLDQEMLPGFEQRAGHFEMAARGRGDRGRVHVLGEILQRSGRVNAEILRQLLRLSRYRYRKAR